ncbi:MAG: effector-associated domain EAD1-containing protein [Polyangiaceae bacterium]
MKHVYLCFAPEDAPHAKRFTVHATPMVRTHVIALTSDANLQLGKDARKLRLDALHDADVVLLLVSPAFLADTEIWTHLLPRALTRQASEGLRVVPILVATATLEGTPLHGRTHLPRTGGPIASRADKDSAWVDVLTELRALLDKIPDRPTPPTATHHPTFAPSMPFSPAGASVPVPARLKLTGKQIGQLRDALVEAYPTFEELEQMVHVELDQRLRVIVPANNNLATIAYKLIDWASAHGRLHDLLRGALAQRPDNPSLRAFVQGLQTSA